MTFDDLEELHNITHWHNLASILQHGILSHTRADCLRPTSVAMDVIQRKRAKVTVPNGRRLHEYANLYFNARNKMMSRIRGRHRKLCVLRIDRTVLNLDGVVIADQNASSDHVRFAAAPTGLRLIDKDYSFARSWKHPEDQIEEWRHGSAVCAEVLVPDCVEPRFLQGCYVSCQETLERGAREFPDVPMTVNRDLFFQTP